MPDNTEQDFHYRSALKALPPHPGKAALDRPPLLKALLTASGGLLTAVVAQAGYGKTSALAQLRRALLARGDQVAWLSCEAGDSAAGFIAALRGSLFAAMGRPAPPPGGGLDALASASELLLRIHENAHPTVLVVDDLHLLADAGAQHFLHYLVRNAPPNFHLVVASRAEPPFPVDDLLAHGGYGRLTAEALRFRLEDTAEFLRRQLDAEVDIELAARIHERAEGWPLAVQLIAASLRAAPDLAAAVEGLSGAAGDVGRHIGRLLAERLSAADLAMLVRASLLDSLAPELCGRLGEGVDAAALLRALAQETGLVTAVEGADEAYRLHPLLRDFLRRRAGELPAEAVEEAHRIAAEWYAAHDRLEDAAEHAFQAGRQAQAITWIAGRMRHLGAQGRVTDVLAWLDRLPPAVVAGSPDIQLAAAWACTLCYRLADAERLAAQILAAPDLTPSAALQADIVRSAVAIHRDDYATARRLIGDHDPALGPLYCNSAAFIALHQGHPEQARYYQALASRQGPRNFYDAMYAAFSVGLSHLLEGQASEAAAAFRPALARAEQAAGRRSLPAAVQAAGLAAACWELGREDEARAVLAHRLDRVEQAGLPDAVLLAYLTLARCEQRAGREGKAADALDALAEIGRARQQPRLVAASLGERIRQGALRQRRLACRAPLAALDALLAEAGEAGGLGEELALIRELAAARSALLDFDAEAAGRALERADALAERLRRGRERLTIALLRVASARRIDAAALRLLGEALGTAASCGLVRVLADDWPAAVEHLPRLAESGAAQRAGVPAAFLDAVSRHCRAGELPPPPPEPGRQPTQLSQREAQVLAALAAGRPNKEIARMLDLGPETVKWHLKNLFAKLNATGRRHAVDRARLLGLID